MLMENFVFENNFSSTSTPGPKIDTFLDGLIQSLEMSIDFNRSEFYFFESINDVSDRSMIMPLRLKLNISGISNKFELGSVASFFIEDQKFSCSILMGDPQDAGTNVNKLLLDSLCIENFNYSIDLNGMLNYSIECYCDITDKSGLRILEINKVDTSLFYFITSDSFSLRTSDILSFVSKS